MVHTKRSADESEFSLKRKRVNIFVFHSPIKTLMFLAHLPPIISQQKVKERKGFRFAACFLSPSVILMLRVHSGSPVSRVKADPDLGMPSNVSSSTSH